MKNVPLIVISLIFVIFITGCQEKAICGNGVLEKGETSANCCADAGCLGQTCKNNTCIDYECTADENCDEDQECIDNDCIDVVCNGCEFASGHGCIAEACCLDKDCDDKDSSTVDRCVFEPKICVHELALDCKDGDMLCPLMCTKEEDNDCRDDYYGYINKAYGFRIRYPHDWKKAENLDTDLVYFTNENDTVYVGVYTFNFDEEISLFEMRKIAEDDLIDLWDAVNVESVEEIFVNGLDAERIRYKIPALVGNYLVEDTVVLSGKDGYIIRSFGWSGQYNQYLEEFQKMHSSFEVIATESTFEQPFMWKIKNTKDSYLFGTMHTQDKRVLDLPDCVISAVNGSDIIYTELLESQSGTERFIESGTIKGRDTLKDMLPDRLYNQTEEFLLTKGIEIEMFEKTKIWVLTQLVPVNAIDAEADSLILDNHITDIGISEGKELGALERIDDQIMVFDTLTEEEQVSWLDSTVGYYSFFDRFINPNDYIVDAYLTGHEQLMMNMTGGTTDSDLAKKIEYRILTQRNKKMADEIYIKLVENPSKSYFFAVGASHYLGEDSIIELLEARGLEIERVTGCHAQANEGQKDWGTLAVKDAYIGITDDTREECSKVNASVFSVIDNICLQPFVIGFTPGTDGNHNFEMNIKVIDKDSKKTVMYIRNIFEDDGITKLPSDMLNEDFVIIYPEDLEEGDYIFEVTVFDLVGNKRAVIEKGFELRKWVDR
ncbi:MAG: TraB/GumN family protein [Candidatus Woesearchaeota archaeon]|nr:TraB/GumN family protein [Candidatus Woesearchaeota archaeon]